MIKKKVDMPGYGLRENPYDEPQEKTDVCPYCGYEVKLKDAKRHARFCKED